MQGAAKVAGLEPLSGWLAIIAYLLLQPVLWGYIQSSLNEVWRAEGEPEEGQPAPPVAGEEMPPRLDTQA